jgi:transposase
MFHSPAGQWTARLALIKDRTATKARLATSTHSLLSQRIKRGLKQIERDVTQVTEATDDIIAADKDLIVNFVPFSGHFAY